jgi:hypothetical protein
MTRLRTRLLAVLGASLLVSLTVSTAFGAHPETASADNRGHQVSAYVHSLLLGSDQESAKTEDAQQDDEAGVTEDAQQDEPATDEQAATDAAPNTHGQCVSDAAHGDEVGGPNDNHGGAVSQAARDTCWQADGGEEPTDGGDASPPTEVSDGPGNSENHGNQGHGRNK